MDIRIKREKGEGGWLARDARTGRLVSVATDKTDSSNTEETEAVVQRVSDRHRAALERLVDR